jgi:mevalonate kinase
MILIKYFDRLCEKRNVACKITGAGNGGFCIAFINNE